MLQRIILVLLKAQRDGTIVLYIQSLDSFAPWLFVFDQRNYARWLHVNIRDTLSQVHPGLQSEFQAGSFVFHKSSNLSSDMSIDHAHENNNNMVKGQ